MATNANALLGCLAGGALGDAIGGVSERGRICLSDDTQLTLATCEAIEGEGPPDPHRVATRFLAWYRERRLIGIGASTAKALRDLEAGAHWASAGARGERAAGNGPAMRAAPLAFVLEPVDDAHRRTIRDICRITHHSEEAYAGALAVIAAVRRGVVNPHPTPGEWIRAAADAIPDSVTRDRLRALLERTLGIREAASEFGTSGWTADTVPIALLGAEEMCRGDFAEQLQALVAVSEDADTIGAIAGQVAGSALGIDRLPTDLLDSVPGIEDVRAIGQQLVERLALA